MGNAFVTTAASAVESAMRFLPSGQNEEVGSLKSAFQGIDLRLITDALCRGILRNAIQQFERSEKCTVNIEINESSSTDPRQPTISGRRRFRENKTPRQTEHDKQFFNVSNGCRLTIKPYGNIAREKSDVLVCLLARESENLERTSVSRAFCRACSDLKEKRKELQRMNCKRRPYVFVTPGPFHFSSLKCRSVCHVLLDRWTSPSSENQLSNAVKKVLEEATDMGANSISFPALGCGRALGFPNSVVAQVMLKELDNIPSDSSLKDVVIVAPDRHWFDELKKNASRMYPEMIDDSRVDSDSNIIFDTDDLALIKVSFTPQTESCISQKNIWRRFKALLKEECLHTENFYQNKVDFFPREFRQSIEDEAKKRFLFLKRFEYRGKPAYQIKGVKSAVEKIKRDMQQEFLESCQHLPKSKILSETAPGRGTVAFVRHAAKSDELFPSYWWSTTSQSFLENSNSTACLVSLSEDQKSAFSKFLANCWDRRLVGQGKDASELHHTGIKLLDVKRIENVHLFQSYSGYRKLLFQKLSKQGRLCVDVADLPNSAGGIKTTAHLPEFMKRELYHEINEHNLFHGTPKEIVSAVISNGLDPRVSCASAMFGKGIYTAERATKSDQYADSRTNRAPRGTALTLILSRVLLGDVFLCDHEHPSVKTADSQKLTRPPCVYCLKDKCKCSNQTLFDSVLGDGKWIFREFVVYDRSQCYPEYIITYERE